MKNKLKSDKKKLQNIYYLICYTNNVLLKIRRDADRGTNCRERKKYVNAAII